MKYIKLYIFFTLITNQLYSQDWMWAKHFNGTGQNQPIGIVQDSNGDYYVYGNFNGTVAQDGFTLNSSGLQDVFLSKYDNTGQILWIKQIGGTGAETAYGVSLSKDGSSIYVTGTFNGTCGFSGTNLTSQGGSDIFMANYASDGSLNWAKNAAYGSVNQINGNITVDDDGNIIMIGVFFTDVTFYGGLYTISFGDPLMRQCFIAKFDESGNPLWSKLITGNNSATYVRSVSTFNNEYYFSGQYIGNLTIDATTVTNNTSYRDGFVFKLNNSGNFQWIRQICGTDNDEFVYKNINDESGNVILAGYFFSNRLKIDSTATDTSKLQVWNVNQGTSDIIILKYSPAGALQWTKTAGTTKDEKVIDIHAGNNKVIITGSYDGKIAFDSNNLLNYGGNDVFIAECDVNGMFTMAIRAIGMSTDIGEAVLFSKTGRNFIAAGDFISDTLYLGAYEFLNSQSGKRDAYIARFGCFDSIQVTVTPVTCVDGMGIPIEDNGSVSAAPSNGNEPYSYNWSNGATTSSITGLGLGDFTVTVTGTYGCTLVKTANVGYLPSVQASVTFNNISCFGQTNGDATAVPSLGFPPYSYAWSTGATTAYISNLSAGVYSVTVSDQCSNTAVEFVTITEPAILNATTSGTQVSSCVENGTATANPTGGTPSYSYLWTTGGTTQTIVDLAAGTYTVTVTDSKGCTVSKNITLTVVTPLSLTASSTPSSGCAPTGTATANPLNGNLPYSYIWTNGGTTQTIINLSPGWYTVTVTDACGITRRRTVIVSGVTALSVTTTSTPSSNCAPTGTATANPANGNPPYSYLWTTGGTTQTITNIPAGSYTVTVTDDCGVSKTSSTSVSTVTTLSVTGSSTPSSYCAPTGTATANPADGNPPYTYIWTTGGTTQTITNLWAGTYTVTVTDVCGITKTRSVSVGNNTALNVSLTYTCTTPVCDGTATANPFGGDSPYTYLWDDGLSQTTQTAVSLCAGFYWVTVTDYYGCTKSNKIRVKPCAKNMDISPEEFFDKESSDNEEDEISGLFIYPNPASGEIFIRVNEDAQEGNISIELSDILSKVVLKLNVNPKENPPVTVNISDLPPGIYIIRWINHEEYFTKKLVIQR